MNLKESMVSLHDLMRNKYDNKNLSQYVCGPFKYLYKQDNIKKQKEQEEQEEQGEIETLECSYTRDRVKDKFVVRNSRNNVYFVFDNFSKFFELLDEMKVDDKCFHEVIFGWKSQKIKFDIDISQADIEEFEIPLADREEYKDLFVNNSIRDNGIVDPELEEFLMELSEQVHGNNIKINPLNLVNAIQEMEVDSNETKLSLILAVIDETIKTTFLTAYGICLDNDSIVTTDSSGKTKEGNKYSYHKVIIKYAVENSDEAAAFTSRFRHNLPKCYHKFVDFGVNKSTQNFRIVQNQKEDSGRFKNIIDNEYGFTRDDTIIQNIKELPILPKIAVGIKRDENIDIGDIPEEDLQKALELLLPYSAGHKFHSVSGNLLIYRRVEPSSCLMCNKVHDHDNTFIASVVMESGVGKVFMNCRHNTQPCGTGTVRGIEISSTLGESRYIGEFLSIMVPAGTEGMTIGDRIRAGWMESTLKKTMERVDLSYGKETNGLPFTLFESSFDKLPKDQTSLYNESTLRSFELVDTLCVKAQMKMGKTKNLNNYINKFFPRGLKNPIIRFVSFRQTFSSNIKEQFPDFTLYNETSGVLNQSRLIVQVESLHRLNIGPNTEHPDLLILDECEAIFEQFDSGLLKNFNAAFATFQWLLRHSKHCVALDANLSDRTFRIIQRMRTGPRGSKVFYHCNRWKNAIEDNYEITTDKIAWLHKLYESIESGDKIAVPISSLSEAETIYETIRKRYPETRVKLYSSKTSNTEKREHFSDVNNWWSEFDVLIYTPTVSAGVSFERVHFNKMYAYFTDMSCPIETCLQMMGRIRNVSEKYYTVCLSATGNNLPTEIEQIKRQLYDRRANLFKQLDLGMLQFEYNEDGEIKFYENDYFTLWLENTRIKNLSLNAFIRRFIDYIADTGANVKSLVPTVDAEMRSELAQEHGDNKRELIDNENKNIADSPELTIEDIEEIQGKIIEQIDILAEEKYAYEKYKLRKHYNWGGDVTKEFISKYKNPRSKRIFKNIQRIVRGNTLEDGLLLIQREERASYQYAINDDVYTAQDLSKKYTFDHHRLAIGFLKICSFKTLTDDSWVSETHLFQQFKKNETLLLNNITTACSELKIRKPNFQSMRYREGFPVNKYVSGILKYINKMISATYGIEIMCRKSERDVYYLSPCSLFSFVDDLVKPMIRREILEIENKIDENELLERDIYENATGFDDEDIIEGNQEKVEGSDEEIEKFLNEL